MDELEQRLSTVLAQVSEQASPAAGHMRNPAGFPKQRRIRLRRPAVAIGVAVGVAVAVAAVVPRGSARQHEPALISVPPTTSLSATTSESASSAPPASASTPTSTASSEVSSTPAVNAPRGTSDGVHPLWSLSEAEVPTQTFDKLPVGPAGPVPVPHTLGPIFSPQLVSVPTLVTAVGTIRFTDQGFKELWLLGQRSQGVFVLLVGVSPDDKEGNFKSNVVLVAPDNSHRVIYHAAPYSEVRVSPDGTLLAVSTRQGVELVDVTSGLVVHRLVGRFAASAWASDHDLLLGASGSQTGLAGLVWRAPWTGPVEQTTPTAWPRLTRFGVPFAVQFDGATGCLRRSDANGDVTANCGGWRDVGQPSSDGRYLPLGWTTDDGTVRHGVLDIPHNQVRNWPVVDADASSWLGADEILIRETGEDRHAVARCNLTTASCVSVTDEVNNGDLWRGPQWFGQ